MSGCKTNPCLYCDCYDKDFDCTMSSIDRSYACELAYNDYIAVTNFFMPMIPPTVTAQEHKIAVIKGKPVMYDTSEIKDAKDKLISHLMEHKPKVQYEGGVRLTVKWLFPKGKHRNGEYRITKPDTDNLQKLLKDCMTKCGYWRDDALVCSEIIEKFWADIPGIYVCIEEVSNEPCES